MKLKGIPVWEQHVEKIVIAGVGACLLGALAWQFLSPTTVAVGKEKVAPGRAFEPVQRAAETLQARLQSEQFTPPEVPQGDIAAQFTERLRAPLLPDSSSIVALGRGLNLGAAAGAAVASDAPFNIPVVPAPTLPAAHAFWSTLDPREVMASPALAALVGPEQPYDKAAVSIQADFDGAALRESLAADPDGPDGPARPLQLSWWREIAVLGVEAQRERLLSDGGWGEATTVPVPPERAAVLQEYLANVRSPGDAAVYIAEARRAEFDVLRPEFYATVAGTPWSEPREAIAAAAQGEGRAQLTPAQRRLAALDQRIERLEEMDGAAPRQPGRQAEPERQGGGGRGRTGGGGSGGGEARPDPEQQARERRQAELTRLRTDRERLAAEVAAAGAGAAGAEAQAPERNDAPVLENPQVSLWAHDLTAVPGETYRYRLRVAINNPLFGQGPALLEAQRVEAEPAVRYSAWSEWTEPVSVDRAEYFFIASAAPADELGPPRAVVEMFTMYYGFYRRASVQVEPGDLVTATARLPENLVIFDVERLSDAGALPQPGQPPAPPGAPGRPGRDAGPGRDREPDPAPGGPRRGVVEPEAPTPPGGRPGQPAPPAGADPALAALGQPAPRELTRTVEALMLDVALAPVQAGAQPTHQVFLRGPTGQLLVRSPENDRQSDVLKRLEASAQAGQTQGAPRPEPEQPERRRPRREDPVAPRGNDGGGGGGS